jgi:hypothetical protein
MSRLDDIIKMPAARRRKLNLSKKTKKEYNKYPRKKRSREELIAYLRINEIRYSRKLEAVRQEGDPNVYDYRKEFGSWANATLAANGPPSPSIGRFDAEYMAKAVIEFDLWTQAKYRAARQRSPDIIPSINFVYKEWGKWSNLTAYAREVSMKKVLNSYMAFWRRLGRVPTIKECEEEVINLEKPIKHFGSKREMDKLLSELEI